MTVSEVILSTIAVCVVLVSGLACNSLLKAKKELVDLLLREKAPQDWKVYVDKAVLDLRLRVEKFEAHWEEMYAKFDRLQKAEKQRDRRSAGSQAELPLEPLETKALTRAEERAQLAVKIRTGAGT